MPEYKSTEAIVPTPLGVLLPGLILYSTEEIDWNFLYKWSRTTLEIPGTVDAPVIKTDLEDSAWGFSISGNLTANSRESARSMYEIELKRKPIVIEMIKDTERNFIF